MAGLFVYIYAATYMNSQMTPFLIPMKTFEEDKIIIFYLSVKKSMF